jgi:hypothetical protein
MRKGSLCVGRLPDLLQGTLLPFLITGVATVVGASGCGFDPDHDYAVTSTWLLNGATPDATRCNELGISLFRLTTNGPGPAQTLDAACDEVIRIEGASYGGFETARSFDYGVTYDYSVDALDANGKVIYRYESYITAYYGDLLPVDLDTVDVFEPVGKTASFSAQWVFSEGDLAADCESNQIDKVAIWVASATDPDLFDYAVLAEADCATGLIQSEGKVLARGDYYFQYVALDARGAIAERGEPLAASVDGPGDLALPRHQFEGL